MTGLPAALLLAASAGAAEASPSPDGVRDVVIVGGGLAGLSAAHFLKDLDVLVLERESRAGGKARAELWGSLGYSSAATYFSEPYGPIKRLLDELGLEAGVLPHPQDSLWLGGKAIADFLDSGIDRLPLPESERAGLRAMAADLRRSADGPLVAMPPVPDGDTLTPELRRLDRLTLREHLTKAYGERAAAHADLVCRGIFGAGAGDVSALQGLNALGAQFGPTAAFPGGLGAIAEAVGRELGPRLRTGATALFVEQDADEVRVTYSSDGSTRTARARRAILAVDAPTALSLARGLPEARSAALRSVRYSAYALVVLALREPLPLETMSLWSLGTVFTDLSLPGLAQPPAGADGPAQLVLAAVPFGAQGQARLDGTPDPELVERVLADAETIFPGLRAKLHGARVVRWRHAMPVAGPGYLTELRPRLARPWGRVSFAGQETEMPYSEGAIASGLRAAEETRARMKRGRVADRDRGD